VRKASVKEEIVRCGHDPVYFISKYVKIRHPKRGLILFKTFKYQDETLECFLKKRFNVILKPRQMGFTELVSAFVVWLMLFHPHQTVLCLATKSDTAKQVVKRVRTGFKSIPKWLLIADITTDNKTSIELANGSSVKSISKSQDAGRSEALSLLIVDEAAHIEGFDDIWTGLKPTVSEGGRIIMLSTPLGVGNVFHKTYVEAIERQNDFNPIHVNWWEHPEHVSDLQVDPKTGKHTSSWFRRETKGFSKRQIAQEYECEFLASGDTFFDAELMDLVDQSVHQLGIDEGLQVYAEPVPGQRYILGVDSATGAAFDRSSVQVLNVESMEQVAEYSALAKPKEFAAKVVEMGTAYNFGLLVVENNAVGLSVIEHLKMAAYPNLFYTRKGAKAGDALGQSSSSSEGSLGDEYVHGVSTQGSNRSFMLNKLEELIRTKVMTIHSPRFRAEMGTFIWQHGRPEARGGYRDDCILAAAFAVWIRDNLYGSVYSSPGLVQAMLGAMRLNRTKNTQIAGASKSPDHVPFRSMGVFGTGVNPYKVTLSNGQKVDILAEMGMYVPRKG